MKNLLIRVVAVLAGLYLGLEMRAAQLQSIEAISVALPGTEGASANGISIASIVSANGGFVAFLSDATDLTTNQVDGRHVQIYVTDITNRITRLVSVSTDGITGANAHAALGGISADGRYVAFASEASNLVASDLNGGSDVFVRDLITGVTTLVSVNQSGDGAGSGGSENPSITPDGRFIVFESDAANLVSEAGQTSRNIFVRDLQNGVTTRVSVDMNEPDAARGDSGSPVISDDGRFVAFVNTGTNLSSHSADVFLRDRELGRTVWVSGQLTNIATELAPLDAYNPLISGDGRFVVYVADPAVRTLNWESNRFLIRYDRENDESLVIKRGLSTPGVADEDESYSPAISADGKRIAFYGFAGEASSSSQQDILLWDAGSDSIELISAAPDGSPSGPPIIPGGMVMSADGRYLAFAGVATNLVTNNVSGEDFQVFLRDVETKTTRLISRSLTGEDSKGGEVLFPSISADGSVVTFNTINADLVEGDHNESDDIFLWNAATDALEIVSVRSEGSALVTAAGTSSVGGNSISADGRFVLFSSDAENIHVMAGTGPRQWYVRDLTEGTNILVTASADNLSTGNRPSAEAALSANGRFVVFTGNSDNLVASDTNGASDVFVRDLQLGITHLVSVALDGSNSAKGASTAPSISRDGRYVAFESTAADLVAGFSPASPQTSGLGQVYVRDLVEGTTVLASASYTDAKKAGNRLAYSPFISPDGRFVLFRSEATDLSDPAAGVTGPANWYVRDLAAQKTAPLYIAAEVERGMNRDRRAAFSDAGDLVAVDDCVQLSSSGPISSRIIGVVLYDFTTGASSVLCTNCQAPALSGDGRFLASETVPARSMDPSVILLTDIHRGKSTWISLSYLGNGHAFSNSFSPIISGNGRYIVYESKASNLLPNDTNGFTDIFLYDQVANQLQIVSKSRLHDGASQKLSINPSLSADGTVIAFQSFSDDLVEGDENQNSDVFVARIAAGSAIDSDGDMIADEWETTYFKTLERDGSGDFDGDGISDWEEWKAGTLPDDVQSALRVTVSASPLTGEVTLSWPSAPGRRYQVQYADSLTGSWASLYESVDTANGTSTVTDSDPGRGEQRFYRVIMLQY